MSLTTDTLRIKALGFDAETDVMDSDITDGLKFDHTGRFLLLSDKAIPRNKASYIEFTVSSYTSNNDIRHIPLMVGVHKEPSLGVLNSDYCLGSIYYTKNSWYAGIQEVSYLAFKVEEKYASRFPIISYVREIQAKVPLRKSVIGIGVNMLYNSINIFVDGYLFYSFSPSVLDMNNDEENYYFAIYASEIGKNIKGVINFGRHGVKYLPNGYLSLYQSTKIGRDSKYDIISSIKVGNRFLNNSFDQDSINASVTIDNQLAPISPSTENYRRDLELILNGDNMTYYTDLTKTTINKHAFQFSPKENTTDYAYISYPIDKYKKIYFEFHCSDAKLINDHIGCPISIGITKNPINLDMESFKLNLYHLRSDVYKIESTYYGFKTIHRNSYIKNPVYPAQPNTIGVLIDLYMNTIELYTESILFCTVESPIIDFRDSTETAYVFFEAPPSGIFEGTGHVICNFGTKNTSDKQYQDPDLEFQNIYDNRYILDLWYYYNYTLKIPYHKEPERVCEVIATMKVISDKLVYGKNIFATITIPEEETEWSPGLNKMWKTYNKISKAETVNNLPDKSIYDIHKLIEKDKEYNKR